METRTTLPAPRSESSGWSSLLVRNTGFLPLVLLTLPIELVSAWLLASPDRVYSRTMTWDLLFNLGGAWHIYNGQTAHVDFHDPVGILSFLLTCIGFWVGGVTVWDFIFGNLVAVAFVFITAIAACLRRLPLFPAVVFVLFTCQLVLTPTNVGALVDDFSFAMSYNAYGWSILCTVGLILFVPASRPAGTPWLDLTVSVLLLLALYYLKITYFLAGLGMVAVALAVCPQVRANRLAWGAMAALLVANAIAPYNWGYLNDIIGAIESGAIRSTRLEMLLLFSANSAELSLYGAILLLAVGLWMSGEAPLRLPLIVGALIIAGLAVLSQNAQLSGLPVCAVAAFLLYDFFRAAALFKSRGGLVCALLALMILPISGTLSSTISIALYSQRAKSDSSLFVVERTNLKGLAVPMDPKGQTSVYSNRSSDVTAPSRLRAIGGNPPLSQYEYVQSILEAISLFDEGVPGGIVMLDAVNPLPFALGWYPARGASLWMDTNFPWRPAEEMFADASYVLIPKFSTYADLTRQAYARYGAYLARDFPVRLESPSWTLLRRQPKP